MTVTTLKQALAAPRAALPGSAASQDVRAGALAELGATGLPTPRREDWRYTDLKRARRRRARLCAARPGPDGARRGGACARRARGAGRRAAPRLRRRASRPGARHAGLRFRRRGPRPRRLLAPAGTRPARTQVSTTAHPLAALNAAYAQSGAWLRVADGARIAGEIRLVLVASGAPKVVAQPRLVVEIGRGAELTIVQHIVDAAETDGWLNVVTEIALGEDSRLTLVSARKQHGLAPCAHLAARSRARGARYRLARARRPRRPARAQRRRREAPRARRRARALRAVARGRRPARRRPHADRSPRARHAQPRGVPRRDRQAAAAACSTARWSCIAARSGIDAQPDRATTCCSPPKPRSTRSPSSRSMSDDVKCSHGSTVGELDAEHLFYLRSRGLDEAARARDPDARVCRDGDRAHRGARRPLRVSPTSSARACARSRRPRDEPRRRARRRDPR